VVMGLTNIPQLSRVARKPISETVSDHLKTPLVLVKPKSGVRSLINRLV
jgi:hypothetical protein